MAELVASLSAIAALLSALWASRSYGVAKEALRIAQLERTAKDSSVEVHLVNIFSVTTEAREKYIVTSLLYTNRSEVSDSIVRVEAILNYSADCVKTNAVVSPTKEIPHKKVLEGLDFVTPPVVLPARGAVSVSLCFQVPRFLTRERTIDSYELEAITASGSVVSVSSRVAGEVSDA